MDIEVERNAYGRQLDSRIVRLQPDMQGGDLEAVFIRAPIIRAVSRRMPASSPVITAIRYWWNKAAI